MTEKLPADGDGADKAADGSAELTENGLNGIPSGEGAEGTGIPGREPEEDEIEPGPVCAVLPAGVAELAAGMAASLEVLLQRRAGELEAVRRGVLALGGDLRGWGLQVELRVRVRRSEGAAAGGAVD